MNNDQLAQFLDGLQQGQPERSDWRDYYHAIRERFWIVLLCLALGAIGGAIFMNRQQPSFKARAVLFIELEQDRVLDKVKGVREEQITSLDMINTVVDLLRSYPFAERVAQRMKLHEDPRFLPGRAGAPRPEITPQEAAGTLVGLVSTQYRKGTRLIDIFVTYSDPALATALVNAYADEYLRYVMEKRGEASKAASSFLYEEVERLRKKMRVSEEAMQSFRQRERTPSLENLQEASQNELAELTKRLAELEQKAYQLDTDLKVARANPTNIEERLRLPSVATEPKVARLNEAIAGQERELLLLSQRYRAKHPVYIAAQTQLASLITERNSVLQNVITLLETARAHLQSQQEEVKKAKDEQETRVLSVTGKSVEYNDLKREQETDRAMYESVLARIKEIDVTKGMTDSPVQVHERALGAGPIGLGPVAVYLRSVLIGLAAGIGIALAIHALDSSIKTVEQAEKISGLPVLAAVPKKKTKKKDHLEGTTLDSIADRHGMIAESFRSLRTSIAMLGEADSRRRFLFTSAMPAEGKTFCSANFAITLAQQGFRTLLIDADLRKPMISSVFFGQHRKPGLSEVLAGQVPRDEGVLATDIENLFILTAGGRAPNPAELLASKRMHELIEETSMLYDRIVIDTAPVLAVSDALLIAPHVHVNCLVLRSFRTPRRTLVRAVKSLFDINCRPAGLVLNFLPAGSGSYYYYYYSGKYDGSYGAKGVYGAAT